MNPKPLSYPGLKCVLQHMEANLRIRLAQHLPSIRTAEKAAPLQIDSLHIEPWSVTMNNTEYMLGVIRTCEMDWLLAPYLIRNLKGDESGDVDEYGMNLPLREEVMPGDIVLSREEFEFDYYNRNRLQEELGRELIRLEHPVKGIPVVAQIEPEDEDEEMEDPFEEENFLDQPNIGADIEDVQMEDPLGDEIFLNQFRMEPEVEEIRAENRNEDVIVPQQDLPNQPPIELEIEAPDAENMRMINWYQARLFQVILKEENAISPFTNYLRLTVGDKTEHLVYQKKIYEARKYLMNKIFGGRPSPINVKLFKPPHPYFGILRVPEGLQLKIRELKASMGMQHSMNCLEPVLDKDSFPLKSVYLGESSGMDEFESPIIGNAEKLFFNFTFWHYQLFQTIMKLRNRRVEWKASSATPEELAMFVRNWLENPRGIGAMFIFEMTIYNRVDGMFMFLVPTKSKIESLKTLISEIPGIEMINHDHHGFDLFSYCARFPIGATSILNFSIVEKDSVYEVKIEEVQQDSVGF